MSNLFGDWIDSVCETFGWGDDDDSSSTAVETPLKAKSEMAKKASDMAHDSLLEQKQCTAPPDTSDDYIHPKSVDDIPSRQELAGRLRALKPRLDAVTRRMHKIEQASDTTGGRPTDPKLAALSRKHLSVAGHYNAVKSGWNGWSDRGQRLELVPLERAIHGLECEVAAFPMP